MADVRPFHGIRYNSGRSGQLGLNVCPPFDMITPQLQKELYDRSAYNIVRLELSRRGMGDPYASSAETQRQWLESGILTRDADPSMYVTEEVFAYRGQSYVRRGLIAAVRVEEYDRGIVLPHEHTRPEWVNDRVRLMGVARANYSPMLVIFRDSIRSTVSGILRAVAGGPPTDVAAPPDMHTLRLWRVTDPGTLEVISNAMAGAQLFIADGHHRYEAALRYRSRVRSEREVAPDESINFRMMMLVCVDEPGLMTLGYHRVIHQATFAELGALRGALADLCDLTPWVPPAGSEEAGHGGEPPQGVSPLAPQMFQDALGDRDGDEVAFGLYGFESGRYHIARMKAPPKAVDDLDGSEYSRLHSVIFRRALDPQREDETLMFFPRPERAVDAVEHQGAQLAFIMRPVPLQEFTAIVSRGWRLPPKATNFHPKPPAGTVMQSLEGGL
ncbi:MAG: DUF1015 domain-containing protein [Dehalococcoidia bacterium]|nr:DUF1015 domain-containing protein [Dehalococcoidia bacterium]